MQAIADFLRQFWVVWLIAIFLAIVFYAYRPKNKRKFERASTMIFDDDKSEQRRDADQD